MINKEGWYNEMKQMYVVKIKYNEINNYIIYVLYKQLAVLKVADYYAEIWYCKIYLQWNGFLRLY